MVEHMFELPDPDAALSVVEDTYREESKLIARQLAAIADLLTVRTAEAEGIDPDPGWSMITGFTRTCAEVGAALNMAPAEASKLVVCAEALDMRLPRIAALLAEGRIDFRCVRAVVTRTELVDDDLVAKVDEELADRFRHWASWSRRRLITTIDAVVHAIDPEGVKERRATADYHRYCSVTKQLYGTALVHARVPATVGARIEQRITELAKSVCAKDPRTMDQRRADAFDALTENRGLRCQCGRDDCPVRGAGDDEPNRIGAVIHVIASAATVRGDSEQPGYLQGFGVIDAAQVRDIARNAAFRSVEEPTVTAEQARRYRPTAATARWVRVRDLTCRYPGCDRPAECCDLDHTTPFNHTDPAAGGLTVPRGLAAYCREHHRVKTFLTGRNGWRDVQLDDGTIVWTSPTGREYRTTPGAYDLFPQLRRQDAPAPSADPDDTPAEGLTLGRSTPRKRNRRRERAARVRRARRMLREQRPINAAQRELDRARRHEIKMRKRRNYSRFLRFLFKGDKPSNSPFAQWINEPLEPEELPPDWRPPPSPYPPQPDDPPF